MADYIIKKRNDFRFAFEGGEETYSLPPVSMLSFETVEKFGKIKDMSLKEQGELCKEFVNEYCPDLKGKEIGDMEYLYILQAYLKSQNDLGEF